MGLKSLIYIYVFVLSISSISISILAAPIAPRNPLPLGTGTGSADGSELHLNSKEWHTKTQGKLGKVLGQGTDGTAYDVEGRWSKMGDYTGDVAAKKFGDKKKGKKEIENLRTVKELIDSGTSLTDDTELWAILPKKPGNRLYDLESFKAVFSRRPGDILECHKYMQKAREAIVDESKHYLRLPGAPEHEYVHIPALTITRLNF